MEDQGIAEAEQELRAAIDALGLACAKAAAAIDAIPDPQRAFEHADRIGNMISEGARDAAGSGGEMRARQVRRIWEQDKLSLAQLARRIGVSKSRASRIVQSKPKPEEDDPP